MNTELNELHRLGDALRGTTDDPNHRAEVLGIEIDTFDIEDRLLDVQTERCRECGWWHESCMLNEDAECEDCEEELYGR